jgi:hypothetical protein
MYHDGKANKADITTGDRMSAQDLDESVEVPKHT